MPGVTYAPVLDPDVCPMVHDGERLSPDDVVLYAYRSWRVHRGLAARLCKSEETEIP